MRKYIIPEVEMLSLLLPPEVDATSGFFDYQDHAVALYLFKYECAAFYLELGYYVTM